MFKVPFRPFDPAELADWYPPSFYLILMRWVGVSRRMIIFIVWKKRITMIETTTSKLPYEAPATEVVEVKNEGIICGSGDRQYYDPINIP